MLAYCNVNLLLLGFSGVLLYLKKDKPRIWICPGRNQAYRSTGGSLHRLHSPAHDGHKPLSLALKTTSFRYCSPRVESTRSSNHFFSIQVALERLCDRRSDTMSRQPAQPQRPLSLTEELEKLEQSITLTLQGKQDSKQTIERVTDVCICPQRSTKISVKPIES